MTTIGYARVSTSDQHTENQVATLKGAGASIVRQEKASGGTRDGRSELATIMDFIQAGDTLMVTRLDRLGRNTRDVLNLVHELDGKGATLKVLEPPLDTSGPTGRILLTVFGMIGEMELSFIRERQLKGIAAAKARGVYKGRPKTLDHQKIIRMKSEGMTAIAIAKAMSCSRAMVYKALKAVDGQRPN